MEYFIEEIHNILDKHLRPFVVRIYCCGGAAAADPGTTIVSPTILQITISILSGRQKFLYAFNIDLAVLVLYSFNRKSCNIFPVFSFG